MVWKLKSWLFYQRGNDKHVSVSESIVSLHFASSQVWRNLACDSRSATQLLSMSHCMDYKTDDFSFLTSSDNNTHKLVWAVWWSTSHQVHPSDFMGSCSIQVQKVKDLSDSISRWSDVGALNNPLLYTWCYIARLEECVFKWISQRQILAFTRLTGVFP